MGKNETCLSNTQLVSHPVPLQINVLAIEANTNHFNFPPSEKQGNAIKVVIKKKDIE